MYATKGLCGLQTRGATFVSYSRYKILKNSLDKIFVKGRMLNNANYVAVIVAETRRARIFATLD